MPSRGVSLPDSRDQSPNRGLLTPYSQTHRTLSGGPNSPYSRSRPSEIRDDIINTAEKLSRRVIAIWRRLTPLQRVLAVFALVVLNVGGILFLIFNEKIFGLLEPVAQKWKHTTGGWIIIWLFAFITAFPPLIGFSAACTTSGFVYGVWEGWLIIASASVAGSFCSFIVSRTILRKYVERLIAHDKRFAALTLTLKHDGLKLLCMIRLCPLPYSLSNGALSTFPSVHPAMYALATAIVSPRLFVPAFIGSRLAAIARSNESMSTGAKVVNWGSIIIGGMIGLFTGWYIYQKTMARARELDAEEATTVRDSVRRTGVPPKQFMDDPEAQGAAESLARSDSRGSGAGGGAGASDDDAIDYFDESPNETADEYHDDNPASNDDDPFGRGDDDDNEDIGLQGPGKGPKR